LGLIIGDWVRLVQTPGIIGPGGLSMGKYLDDARTLYAKALNELTRWGETKDQVLLRDAAEKAWGAVTQAANELLKSYGYRVPRGTGARRDQLFALERQERRLRSMRFRARFSDAEKGLHEDCFYDDVCSLPLVTGMVA
jgi:hypothetical protein